MNKQSLPKYLFLNEQSEEMQDQRIKVKIQYDTLTTPPSKVIKKKINNTLKFKDQLADDFQINNLAYSNKLGLVIVCVKNQLLIIDFTHLQSLLSSPQKELESLRKVSATLKFQGKVYLSPNQTKLLLVNENQIIFYDLQKFNKISNGINQFKHRHFVFVNQTAIVGWNFLSKAYFYSNINENFSNAKQIENHEKCTSVNVILGHIILSEKINPGDQDNQGIKLHIWSQDCSQLVNEINLHEFQNPDNYLFNYTQVLSFFSIKQQNSGQFGLEDTYGLVVGYYDDYQEQPDRRYLNFLKGNLIQRNSQLEIRGFELFQSPNEQRSFYYGFNPETNEEDLKLPFEVQIIYNGSMILITIQRLETVFVVDSTLKFSQLNLYSVNPVHEIKLEGGKFFKGVALMKNMLNVERIPPKQDSNPTCNMICKDFDGEFLSLYFPSKQTQLTVPFPSSILVLGDNKILRRYAICTTEGFEQYEAEKIKQGISKLKHSPYVQKISQPIKIQPEKQLSLKGGLALDQKKQISKKQQKVQVSLFGQGQQKTALFGEQKKQNNFFGGLNKDIFSFNQQKKNESSLFEQKPITQQSKSELSQLFQKPEQKRPSLFSAPAQTINPLFGAKPKTQTSTTPASFLFGSQTTKSPLFGEKKQQEIAQKIQIKKQESPKQIFQNIKPKQTQSKKPFIPIEVPKQKKEQKKPVETQVLKAKDKIQVEKPEEKKTPLPLKKVAILFSGAGQMIIGPKKKSEEQTKIQTEPKKTQPIKQKKLQIKQSKQPETLKTQPSNKLNQLSILLGHESVQKLPEVLKSLSNQQIQALLQSFKQQSKVLSKVQQQKKQTLQEEARGKLLKKQHFKKIVQKFDRVKSYIKGINRLNQHIESTTIFSLKNAHNILKINYQSFDSIKNGDKSSNNIESVFPLIKIVRNYSKRMQILQRSYLAEQMTENKHPNKMKIETTNNITNELQMIEERVQIAQYYQNLIIPDKNQFKSVFGSKSHEFNFNQNFLKRQFGSNFVEKLKQKSNKSDLLKQQVKDKIQQIDSYLNLLNKKSYKKTSRISFSETRSIIQKKTKGQFKFSLDSSSDQEIINKPLQVFSFRDENKVTKISEKKINKNQQKTILIKFKPKIINLYSQKAKITPLFDFNESESDYLMGKQILKAASFFKTDLSGTSLQNSVKKSVDFKDKIPLNRNESQKKQALIKKIESNNVSNQPSSDEEIQAPAAAMRSISILHQPPKNVAVEKKQIESKPKQQINFKKTQEKDIKKDLQKKASLFGKPANQPSEIQKTGSLFGNTNIQFTGIDNKKEKQQGKASESIQSTSIFGQKKQVQKSQPSKSVEPKEAPSITQVKQKEKVSLFGQKVVQQKISAPLMSFGVKEPQKETLTKSSQQPKFLFGTTSLKAEQSNSLFGLNIKNDKQKQKQQQGQEKKNVSLFGSKSTKPIAQGEKKPSLFGDVNKKEEKKDLGQNKVSNENKAGLFGNIPSVGGLFGNINKIQNKKDVEKKAQKVTSENKKQEKPLISLTQNRTEEKSVISQPDNLKAMNQAQQSMLIQTQQNQGLFGNKTEIPNINKTQSQTDGIFGTNNLNLNQNQVQTQNENKQIIPTSGNLFGNVTAFSHSTPAFGAQNKFLAVNTQNQPVNTTFNPNQISFGGGFDTINTSNSNPFGNVGTNNNAPNLFGSGNLFGGVSQSNPNTQASNPLFGQQSSPPLIQGLPSNPNLFGNNQQQNQSQASGLFGQTSTAMNPNQNFLTGFQFGSNPTQAPPQQNSNNFLMKPRQHRQD